MAIDVTKTLRRALGVLEAERAQVDRQIGAVRGAISAAGNAASRPRPRMSAAARRAVSKRMKAFWAKRRAAQAGKKRAG